MKYRLSLLLASLILLPGCVTVPAHQTRDEIQSTEWPGIASLGPECKRIIGTFQNEGVQASAKAEKQATHLSEALGLPANISTLSFDILTRRTDQNGDSIATLFITPDGNPFLRRELTNCFCIKQALACTQIEEASWSLPRLGEGRSQKNIYFSATEDEALLAKTRGYHADTTMGVPIVGKSKPWAKFKKLA